MPKIPYSLRGKKKRLAELWNKGVESGKEINERYELADSGLGRLNITNSEHYCAKDLVLFGDKPYP